VGLDGLLKLFQFPYESAAEPDADPGEPEHAGEHGVVEHGVDGARVAAVPAQAARLGRPPLVGLHDHLGHVVAGPQRHERRHAAGHGGAVGGEHRGRPPRRRGLGQRRRRRLRARPQAGGGARAREDAHPEHEPEEKAPETAIVSNALH